MTPTKKCFVVTAPDADPDSEDSTMIIFAHTDIAARRRYADANDYPPGELGGIHVMRRTYWDRYAPGPVPALEMIDAGWHFECHGCYANICEDNIGLPIGDDDDWGLAREYGPDISRGIMRPVEPNLGSIYCCQQCYDDDRAEKRRIRRMRARAIQVATARLAQRHPGVEVLDRKGAIDHHTYIRRDWRTGRLLIHDLRLSCTFPGMRYSAEMSMSDEAWRHGTTPPYAPQTKSNALPMSARQRDWKLSIDSGDQEAWDAFKAGTTAAASIPADHPLANATEF